MLSGKGISSFGTAMRCAMTLIILIASLARGAVVLELKHEHHHDHDFHHSDQHEPGNGQSGNDGDGETAPERNTDSHTHRLMVDAGPMMPTFGHHAGFVPVGGSDALAILHEQCPDGPHFELIKPPQIS